MPFRLATRPPILLLSILVVLMTTPSIKATKIDAYSTTIALAKDLSQSQPKTISETIVDYEASDILAYVGNDRLLVGSLMSGSKLGTPKFGNLYLYDLNTGREIWSIKRPNVRNGEYFLLTTYPTIIVMAKSERSTVCVSYDPVTGQQKWEIDGPSSTQVLVDDALYLLMPADSNSGNRNLRSIDMSTGSNRWQRSVHSQFFPVNSPGVFCRLNSDIYVGGSGLIRINKRTGDIEWSQEGIEGISGSIRVGLTPTALLAYDSRTTAMIDFETGEPQWVSTVEEGVIEIATMLDDQVLRVVGGGSNRVGFVIDSIDLETAQVVWSATEDGSVASPLVTENGRLLYTTDSEMVGLELASGESLFRSALPEDFKAASPTLLKSVRQPDVFRMGNHIVHVARAMAGVAAFSLANGEMIWQQPLLYPRDDSYSADRLFAVMARDLPVTDSFDPGQPAAASTSPSMVSSPFMTSAQRQYENTKQRSAVVLRKQNPGLGERQAAHQSNAMNAQLAAANIQVDMAMGQMQAAADLFSAVVGLQDAIKQAMEVIAVQGVISRKYIELRSYMTLGQESVRENYFIWPFKGRGRGLTLVELDTGKRAEFWFSPEIQPLQNFGFDTASFAISPDGRTISVVGIGLNTQKYSRQSKWGFTLPKASILNFAITSLEFSKRSRLQVQEEERLLEEQRQIQAILDQSRVATESIAIFTVAQIGNIERMKEMLESGIDVNVIHPYDTCGPLMFAVIGGQLEMVEFLIERGADVNTKDSSGKSALFFATQFDHDEIAKILREAGAK